MRAADLYEQIMLQITKQSDRDKQRKIGPSEIGGCPLCIGEKLALAHPELYPDLEHEESFGLGSWIGTAVHHFLEKDIEIPGSIKEQKNLIYDLEGYGQISGSTDFYKDGHIVDWKVVGKWSYDSMKLAYSLENNRIPKTIYRAQQHLYGYGWEQAGYPVETVNLCVIPKMSNNPNDIRFFTEIYNREVALKALARLESIYKRVRQGRLESLPMDKDCYTCTRVLFRA